MASIYVCKNVERGLHTFCKDEKSNEKYCKRCRERNKRMKPLKDKKKGKRRESY